MPGFSSQILGKVSWLLSHSSQGAAAPPGVHNWLLRLLLGSHSPDRLRLQSRAGLNLRQPEFGFSRQRKTYRGSMHGAAWECCIHKWEAEERTGSDILGHITASVTGLPVAHGAALGFKTSAGWGKEDARWFLRRRRDDVTNRPSAAWETNLRGRDFCSTPGDRLKCFF